MNRITSKNAKSLKDCIEEMKVNQNAFSKTLKKLDIWIKSKINENTTTNT